MRSVEESAADRSIRAASQWAAVRIASVVPLAVALGVSACSGAPAPTSEAPPPVATQSQAVPTPPAEVERPESLAGVARLGSWIPNALRNTAELDHVRAAGKALEIETQAVDVLLLLEPRFTDVKSHLLTSQPAPAVDRIAEVLEAERVTPQEEDDYIRFETTDGFECIGLPSGSAGRLVCSRSTRPPLDVARFAAETLASDASLPVSGVRLYGQGIRHGTGRILIGAKMMGPDLMRNETRRVLPTLSPLFDPLAEPLLGEGVDLLSDLDRLDASLAVDSPAVGVNTLSVEVHLDGTSSFVSRELGPSLAAGEGPPEPFWRLPRDAHSGFYFAPGNLEPLRAMNRGIATRWSDALLPIAPQLEPLVRAGALPVARLAYASGFATRERPAATYYGLPREERADIMIDTIHREVEFRAGWNLLAVEAPADEVVAYLDQVHEAYEAGPFYEAIYALFRGLCDDMPNTLTRGAPATKQLPQGSVEYRMQVDSSVLQKCFAYKYGNLRAAPPVTGVIVVAPDPSGDWTWVGLSLLPDVLYEKMAHAIAGAEVETLRGREGLGMLEEKRAPLGGFITHEALVLAKGNYDNFYKGGYSVDRELDAVLADPSDAVRAPRPFFVRSATTPNGLSIEMEAGWTPMLERRMYSYDDKLLAPIGCDDAPCP